MRLVFAGTPDFAAGILESLVHAGFTPQLVLTQPDRPQGRGRKLVPSAVKDLARRHGIDVFQPETLSARRPAGVDAVGRITASPFDLLVVAAYGLMIPERLLTFPAFGAINVHASLLPRWRGASPVEYAIMNGDRETGVSLMQMDAGLDTGDVLAQSTIPVGDDETGTELTTRLAELGATLLCSSLPDLGTFTRHPQDEAAATYAPKLTPETGRIVWTRPAREIHNQVRALAGRATAWTRIVDGNQDVRVRIHAGTVLAGGNVAAPGEIVQEGAGEFIVVQTGDGRYGIRLLQLSVGKGTVQPAASARNGFRFLATPHAAFSVQ